MGITVLLALLPSDTAAQAESRAHLSARVVDRQQRPVERAEALWLRAGGAVVTRSDSSGVFTFGEVPPGRYRIALRRLGYAPLTLDLAATRVSGPRVEIVLTATPALLGPLQVTSTHDPSRGKLDEFHRRREHPNRLGYFLGPADLARSSHPLLSDYLRGIPGVTVTTSTQIGNLVQFRGCRPTVWVDGLRMADMQVDEVVQAGDVAAVEVYVSLAGSPGRYRELTRPCGSLVVWMKT